MKRRFLLVVTFVLMVAALSFAVLDSTRIPSKYL